MLTHCDCKHQITNSFSLTDFVRTFHLGMHRDTLQDRCDGAAITLHGYRRETDHARILFGCMHNRAALHIPFYPKQFADQTRSDVT